MLSLISFFFLFFSWFVALFFFRLPDTYFMSRAGAEEAAAEKTASNANGTLVDAKQMLAHSRARLVADISKQILDAAESGAVDTCFFIPRDLVTDMHNLPRKQLPAVILDIGACCEAEAAECPRGEAEDHYLIFSWEL
jgi:hypothetical protein